MKIQTLVLGAFETNSYILSGNRPDGGCLIVDTGLDSEPLAELLDDQNLRPEALVLTHGHADHVAGASMLRAGYPGIKVLIHKTDAQMLGQVKINLPGFSITVPPTGPADETIEEGQVIEYAGITLEILHTPGHTPGGICLYCRRESVLFSGDTLFAASVGRSDLPGSNGRLLIENIRKKLLTLPEETTVYPGHGPATTIGHEKKFNPFV